MLERARMLSGRTIGEVARRLWQPLPDSQRRAKGFTGQLVERALGASAGSKGEPDFVEIGVELKTLPIGENGNPKESTFVASLPLMSLTELDYEESYVASKLERVLFMPVQAFGEFAHRLIGAPILWSPSDEERRVFQEDYDRIAGLVLDGRHDEITGHLGTYLQVRPKAASAGVQGKVMDEHGRMAWTGPRGFYLRPSFTATVLAGHHR